MGFDMALLDGARTQDWILFWQWMEMMMATGKEGRTERTGKQEVFLCGERGLDEASITNPDSASSSGLPLPPNHARHHILDGSHRPNLPTVFRPIFPPLTYSAAAADLRYARQGASRKTQVLHEISRIHPLSSVNDDDSDEDQDLSRRRSASGRASAARKKMIEGSSTHWSPKELDLLKSVALNLEQAALTKRRICLKLTRGAAKESRKGGQFYTRR
ncbi:hypothetical protein SCHPADRAFT_628958 [Schizopora paradoxa]|uniref:Uncharacterized protein n=1 Tax=Schizopora paradoxa TaxID=27342 RepID=A0A0H2R7P6_9AGAM|nr:hypothetical protein SCHPADRAFT_628958 [Schizopora paradoxa]